jgi:hypothetical protein
MQRYFLSLLGVLLVATTLTIVAEGKDGGRYNVLSIGSRHYYGLLTARFIDYMEMKAYLIANLHKCKVTDAEKENEKIAMTDLFDYITGADTGAIIAGAMLMKNND